jgi:multimeric flavodoxin WrbA
MKILGICGSPRKGNTEFLLREALKAAREKGAGTELILLREKRIEHCDGCLKCDETGECHIRDDMQEIYKKLEDADAIVLASPSYYENVTGLFKDFIDRMNPYYTSKKLEGKKVGIIGVGGGSGKDVIKIIKGVCDAFQMDVIQSIEFGIGNDPTNASKNKEAIEKARKLGESLTK